jgi:hypothetical protein
MKPTILVLLAATLASCGYWAYLSEASQHEGYSDTSTQPPKAPDSLDSSEPDGEIMEPRLPRRYPSFGDFLAYTGPDCVQHYNFGARYDATDPTSLAVYNSNPLNYTWRDTFALPYEESFEFGAAFEIVAVQAKSRDHYYVAGRLGSDDIIERWKRSNASQPGGPGGYVMKRTQLFRGPLGGIRCIAVDHLARFVLILHGSAPVVLSKIGLPGGGNPVSLYSSGQIPELVMTQPTLFPQRHVSQGIVWTLEDEFPSDPWRHVVFLDGADDGILDSWAVYLGWDYSTVYGVSGGVWLDKFIAD